LAFLACRGVGAYVYMQSCMHNSDNYMYRPKGPFIKYVVLQAGREGSRKVRQFVTEEGCKDHA